MQRLDETCNSDSQISLQKLYISKTRQWVYYQVCQGTHSFHKAFSKQYNYMNSHQAVMACFLHLDVLLFQRLSKERSKLRQWLLP